MKKALSLLLAAALLFALAGCGRKQTDSSELNIYFKNIETNTLSPIKVKYDGDRNATDMAKFALNKLIEGPSSDTEAATLPKGTKLTGVFLEKDIVTVDFTRNFASYEGVDELMARFSVVSTLCDIPGIEKVKITIEGAPLISRATGTEVGVLGKSDIVYEDTGAIPHQQPETTVVTLYFPTSDATLLKAERRTIETQNSLSIEKTVISELLKGPTSSSMIAVIPQETKLLNIETSNGVCFVNFSAEFVTKFSGGTNTGMLIVYSIVNSLSELDDIESVQILIEGKTGAEFGDFVFDEPIVENPAIVQKEE